MKKVVLKFFSKSVAVIIEGTRGIVSKMTGNVDFPTPNPTLPTITALVNDLEVHYLAAERGDLDQKLLMRSAKKLLLQNLALLQAYVQTTSNGDETLILSTGFGVRKANSKIGLLPPPANVRTRVPKESKMLRVNWQGVKDRSFYSVQYTETPTDEKSWLNVPKGTTGKTYFDVEGLVRGTVYYFRVFTLCPAGISGPSDPAEGLAP